MRNLRRRRLTATLALGGSGVATLIGLAFLVAILWTLIALGLLLFVLTFVIIAAARLLLLRLEQRGAQV